MEWFVLTLARGSVRPAGSVQQPSDLADEIARLTGIANLRREDLRYFSRLEVAAVRLPDNFHQILKRLHEVRYVAAGSWYLNLLAAWEYVVKQADDTEGAVVNLSLGPPPSESNSFDPEEPLNRATRVAYENGVVTVVAVGNDGDRGNNTMTRWAIPDWVISVGASDAEYQAVEPYSSRGIPGSSVRPTVVAPGYRTKPNGPKGTSFAAPRVTDVILYIEAFLLSLWKMGGQQISALKLLFPNLIRSCLKQMARPIAGGEHERGAGVVGRKHAVNFLRELSIDKLRQTLPLASWISESLLQSIQSELADPIGLVSKHHLVRFRIDTAFEWSLPAYVSGLLQFEDSFSLRANDQFEARPEIEIVRTPFNQAVFTEISILPHSQRAKHLTVSKQEKNAFRTIGDALNHAEAWDVIHIRPGIYEEIVTPKSGVTLVGQSGTLIHHTETPLRLWKVSEVGLVGLEISAEGARQPAVDIYKTRNIVFQNCKLTSSNGNAVNACFSKRGLFNGCWLHGKANAGFFAFNREFEFGEQTQLLGSKCGILFYATAAVLSGCSVLGEQADAVIFIPPNAPWTQKEEVGIFTHPMGDARVKVSDVSAKAVLHGDLPGELSSILYGLRVRNSKLTGAFAAIAASDFEAVVLDHCHTVGGQGSFAVLSSPDPLPIRISDQANALAVLTELGNLRLSRDFFEPTAEWLRYHTRGQEYQRAYDLD